MENSRNRINVKLVNNAKKIVQSKPSHMSHKIFDNNLAYKIRKSRLALKLNKPSYTGMCILELIKV